MVQLECRCGPGETAGTHQDEGGKEARRQFPGISSQPACRASGSPGACSCWPGAWVLGAFSTGVVSSCLGSLRTGPGPGRLLPCEGPEVHLQTSPPSPGEVSAQLALRDWHPSGTASASHSPYQPLSPSPPFIQQRWCRGAWPGARKWVSRLGVLPPEV